MPRSISRVVLFGGLLLLATVAGGYQRGPTWNLAPVEGTVSKDGHPLANIQVVFLTDVEAGTQGPRASGFTDEAGRYRLRTDNGSDGAVVGKHRVCLIDDQDTDRSLEAILLKNGAAKRETPMPKRRVPFPYEQFNETLLRVEVRPGPQVIDLEVK